MVRNVILKYQSIAGLPATQSHARTKASELDHLWRTACYDAAAIQDRFSHPLLRVTVQATGAFAILGALGCSRLRREEGPNDDFLDNDRAVEKLVDWIRTISRLKRMKVPQCL